ncbi:MAG: hypothetical protein AAB654_26375, partial [Acidobacteriota bacterium]
MSSLHKVSVHIDSPEAYNALYRFFEKDLQWPVIYGKPGTPDRQGRRSYAGISHKPPFGNLEGGASLRLRFVEGPQGALAALV